MKTTCLLLYTSIILLPALCSCISTQAVLKKCEKGEDYDEAKGLFGCKYKVVVSFSTDRNDTDVNYITVNEVFDEKLKENVKLFYPIGIRFQNQDLLLVYPLKFLKSVNNKAYEIFFHKDNTDNYQGCTTSYLQTLCGEDSDTDESQLDQQYVHGFCCACNKEEYISHPYHIRSGQDCSDTSTPNGLDKSYHTSAHCLKFDPVWYRVNQLEEPYIDHQVEIDVFTQRKDNEENKKWIPLSEKSQHLVIGSTKKFVLSQDKKVSARYGIINEMTKLLIPDPLKYRQNRLLIPESSPYSDYSKYIPQQLKGNASEFLLIDERYIRLDGSKCDRIGVSYEAFYQQEDKCLKPAQSCLDNQPMHFWLKDVANQMQHKNVKFFLGGYAELSKPPLYKSDAHNWKLALKYKQNLTLKFSVEISADSLIPVFKGTECDIEEVYYYTENDNETLSIYLYNPGMISNNFDLLLDSCNVSLSGDSKRSVTVGPHQSKEVIFKVTTQHSNYIKHCTVSVLNHRQQKVAERQIWFKEGQRCICLINCKCSCEADGFICGPLDGEDELQISFTLFIVILIFFFLLIIGLVKATLSIFCPIRIGQFGLSVLAKSTTLKEYYEKDIKKFAVLYDKNGYPIHPTKDRPVQFLPTWKIIMLNLFIGFYFPVIFLYWLFDRLCKKQGEQGFIKQREESAEPFLSMSSPDLRGLKNYFDTSPNKLTSTMKDLSIEQFRKKKNDISKLKTINEEAEKKLSAYDITPPDSDDEKLVSSDVISRSSVIKGVEQVRSQKRKTRSSTATATAEEGRSIFKRQSIQNLLQKKQVYCNYNQESKILHNSGTQYSLRGVLRRLGRKFNFELGDYVIQTYENEEGSARLLHPNPQRIIHPMQFNLLLNASGVHLAISEDPKYPCLNASPPKT